jgi:hypothetical protein
VIAGCPVTGSSRPEPRLARSACETSSASVAKTVPNKVMTSTKDAPEVRAHRIDTAIDRIGGSRAVTR